MPGTPLRSLRTRGYGSTSWIRVLGRVLLTKRSRRRRAETPTGARGWRNFVSVPIEHAIVRVHVGERSYEVQADPSGIIDVVVDVDLEPGWHRIGLELGGLGRSDSTDLRSRSADDRSGSCPMLMTRSWSPPCRGRCWPLGTPSSSTNTRGATTPGMPVLYERLTSRHPGAPLIYSVDGSVERRAHLDPLLVAQSVSRRRAAADRLGTHSR